MQLRILPRKIRKSINELLGWGGTPYVVIVLVIFIILLPFYWTFITSFKLLEETYQWPPTLLPQQFSLSGYRYALLTAPVPMYLVNSVIYSLCTAAIVIFIGTLTVYGLTMYPYKGSGKILLAFFATRIVPPQALWLPFIIFFSRIGMINSRPPVIIFNVIMVYPLSVWMLGGLFQSFPRELVDSATIDGCSRLGALFRVVIPVIAPALAAVAIIAFLWAWGEFMFPFLILNKESFYPITVGAYWFLGDEGIMWNALAATQILAISPGLLFFIIAQRHIVKGLTAGAVKG